MRYPRCNTAAWGRLNPCHVDVLHWWIWTAPTGGQARGHVALLERPLAAVGKNEYGSQALYTSKLALEGSGNC